MRPLARVLTLLLAFAVLAPTTTIAAKKSSGGTVHVKGYYRKDGTYVQPHTRSAPGSKSSYAADPSPRLDPLTDPPYVAKKPVAETPAVKPTIAKGEKVEGKVVGVTDGDTLTLLVDKTQYKIRLQGIDAPESAQPFGTQAKKALSDKVFGKTVKVLSQGADKYGRTLGVVYADGCVNTAMVKEGFAWHYKQYVDNNTLAKAEEEARAAKAGLWADAKPVAPWDWRHKKPEKASAENEDPFAAEPFGQPAESKPAQKPEQKQEQTVEKKYWMTNSSSKRHNSGCRYFENSKGHYCGPNDGIPCKICGG